VPCSPVDVQNANAVIDAGALPFAGTKKVIRRSAARLRGAGAHMPFGLLLWVAPIVDCAQNGKGVGHTKKTFTFFADTGMQAWRGPGASKGGKGMAPAETIQNWLRRLGRHVMTWEEEAATFTWTACACLDRKKQKK
jgi:hypothetical protein